ncbi:DUF805 domain-containing protein [Brevundimonas subvibrioides]|uniref:DUF805 domain-containing protein n=1 Tax=Brevundimonas subvibrioides TaxID=74313 RepID=UPI0022B5DB36|nr:DUF805 domain-containing protein [Brevundimonas subvibrioides]
MNDFIQPYRKYAQFSGRSDRKEFWYFILFYIVVAGVLSIVDGIVFAGQMAGSDDGFSSSSSGPLQAIFILGSFIPLLAVTFRRLHDIGKTAWWIFLGLIPVVGTIVLIIWYARKGEPVPNAYGEVPAGSLPA